MKGVFAAELVGTFFLTFLGAGAILQATALGEAGFGLLGIALAHGIALSIAVSLAMNVSGGHINPAVTIAMLVGGKVKAGAVPIYLIAQVGGSLLAALVLRSMFSGEVIDAAKLGTPGPGPGFGMGTVIFVEFVLTFILVVSVWGTAVDKRAPAIGGFGVGLAVFADILVGGPITGAAMNPARVLGPALAGGYWDLHAAYWIGPILGGIAATLFYKGLVLQE
ncbi:MAG: aquaporin [Candidatus Eiseniibacteriota bacterium]